MEAKAYKRRGQIEGRILCDPGATKPDPDRLARLLIGKRGTLSVAADGSKPGEHSLPQHGAVIAITDPT